MALLRVFLVGCVTLCLFTAIIYNFFLPKISYDISVRSAGQSSPRATNYADRPAYRQADEQIDKLNYDQIDIVKYDLVKEKAPRKDESAVGSSSTKRSTTLPAINKTSSSDSLNFFELGFVNNKEEEKLREEGFKNYAFNLLVSNRLGYKRDIPDTRHERCGSVNYTNVSKLPAASIIICFYNEAKSTLFRTVQSILDRTDHRLITEIILVNDFSDSKQIKLQVEVFDRSLLNSDRLPFFNLDSEIDEIKNEARIFKDSKVVLYNLPERSGLIRARSFGAQKARGKVLVFLDSHVEVNRNWLVPLLDRVRWDRTTVAIPIIDLINAYTFEYRSSPLVKGSFTWTLHYSWISVSEKPLKDEADFIKPISTATMAGGLFAMDRDYYFEMGDYDKRMDIWGSENIEMSFRIWMCGGKLEVGFQVFFLRKKK